MSTILREPEQQMLAYRYLATKVFRAEFILATANFARDDQGMLHRPKSKPDRSQLVHVRPIERADASQWLALRCELWPGGSDDHRAETMAFFRGELHEPQAVFVAEAPDGNIEGFVELSIRTSLSKLVGIHVG
jgi:hypothetical protein